MHVEAERRLIERARSGSLEAFDELVDVHRDRLYRFVVVRGATPADAEDIVQDAFLAAWRHLGSYRERWRFSTWLFTIARRRAARRQVDHVELPAVLIDASDGPRESAQGEQRRDNIWLLARELLPSSWFDVLWLYYAEDRQTGEIARILGRSVAWVKVTLHRSRKRLAEWIDADDWLSGEVATNE